MTQYAPGPRLALTSVCVSLSTLTGVSPSQPASLPCALTSVCAAAVSRMRQHTQPRPSTFSFGGHLFEWPEADGKTAPLQKAPDSWQELFASNHFRDPDIALTTLEACKRGHQFTLERAPRLSLFLDMTLPTPVFQSKQQAVSALIVKRQPLTTGLRLVGTRTGWAPEQTPSSTYAFPKESAKTIDRLTFSPSLSAKDPTLPVLLPSLQNVTTLDIGDPLTDDWLRVVLGYLPKAKDVSAKGLLIYSTDVAKETCQWTHFTVKGTEADTVCMQQLARLPKTQYILSAQRDWSTSPRLHTTPARQSPLQVTVPDGGLSAYVYEEVRQHYSHVRPPCHTHT